MRRLLTAATMVALAGALVASLLTGHTRTRAVARERTVAVEHVETIYVRDVAPNFEKPRDVQAALPAWQAAANQEFARVWHTQRVRLVYIGRRQAPKGAVTATFVWRGPVKGALAYHTVTNGAPAIIVYAGTDDYYGYSNSVSFTHELFELLADPTISIANQGWPYDWVWLGQSKRLEQAEGTVWINEVCDPVESDHYLRKGADGEPVWISDWVTPNWFNDEVAGGYDHMGLVQQPFTILKGGYAQYFDPALGWQEVTNFRGAGPDADGFLKGEQLEPH